MHLQADGLAVAPIIRPKAISTHDPQDKKAPFLKEFQKRLAALVHADVMVIMVDDHVKTAEKLQEAIDVVPLVAIIDRNEHEVPNLDEKGIYCGTLMELQEVLQTIYQLSFSLIDFPDLILGSDIEVGGGSVLSVDLIR